jgi:hypothetical protein
VWPEAEPDREDDEQADKGDVKTRDSAVYVPAEHPLIAHMATSLGLNQKAQKVSFYFYASFEEVGDPTFPDEGPDPEDVDAYFVLARAVGRALHVYAGGREETPIGCSVGFHLDASCDELASAFEAAGYQPRSLNDYLEASMRSPMDPQSDLAPAQAIGSAAFALATVCAGHSTEGARDPAAAFGPNLS